MLWYLFNTKTNQKISGEGEEELIRIAFALGEAAMWNWVAHVEGHNGWKRMREMGLHLRYELEDKDNFPLTPNQRSKTTGSVTPEVAGFQGNSIESESNKHNNEIANDVMISDVRENSLLVDQDKDYQIREHDRFEERYRVVIETDGQTFISHSKDISVGGILLEDPVPDWVIGYCNVKIIKPEKREEVQLMCSLVESDDPSQIRFRVALAQLKSLEDEAILNDWLKAG